MEVILSSTWHLIDGRFYRVEECAHHSCRLLRKPGSRLCHHHLELNARHAQASRERRKVAA